MHQSGEKEHHFSSRWAMLAAMLGMAIGTGSIWCFPPTAAQNGGGSFLIAWAIFLLLWSIPLIPVEFAFGKATRYGPVGAFSRMFGRRFAWRSRGRVGCGTRHLPLRQPLAGGEDTSGRAENKTGGRGAGGFMNARSGDVLSCSQASRLIR